MQTFTTTNPQRFDPEAWRASAKCASGSTESVELFPSDFPRRDERKPRHGAR